MKAFALVLFFGLCATSRCSSVAIEPSTSYTNGTTSTAAEASNGTSTSSIGTGNTTTVATPSITKTEAVVSSTTTMMISPSSSVKSVGQTTVTTNKNLTFANLNNVLEKYKCGFKLDETWDDKLADNTSSEFQAKKSMIINEFDRLFANDSHYKRTTISGFSQGSIKVEVIIEYYVADASNTTAPNVIATTLQTTPSNIGTIAIAPYSLTVLKETPEGTWDSWNDVGACISGELTQIRVCTVMGACNGKTQETRKIPCTPTNSAFTICSSFTILSLSAFILHLL